jgi:hypothetical protein
MDREPDELEQADDLPADLTEPLDGAADVPEADALDQHRGTSPGETPDELREIPADVPEADALEQSRDVPVDDDDRES